MKTAVILAAGAGTRLHPFTLGRPKCLVEVAGRPLLDRTLAALEAEGCQRLVLVTGYEHAAIAQFLAHREGSLHVDCVHNAAFATTNNAYSLWTARHSIPDAFVLLDGDLIFETAVLHTVLTCPGDAALAVERRSNLGDEEMKVVLRPDGAIATVNKTVDPRTAIGESVGLARFSAHAAATLWTTLDSQVHAGHHNVFYELAFEQMISSGWKFQVADVTGLLCMEIDTPSDLDTAQNLALRIDTLTQKAMP